jgi:hypothetical protein
LGTCLGFPESRFRELVTSCQIFGSEIWTTISGLRSTIKGREDAFDSRQESLNEDIQLLRIGSDYWKHSNHVPNDLHTLQLPIGKRTRAPNTIPEESQQPPRSLLNEPEIQPLSLNSSNTITSSVNKPSEQDNYMTYYTKTQYLLGEDTANNRFIAKTITDQEILRRQMVTLSKSMITDRTTIVVKQPTRKVPRSFDGDVKSDFTAWKREVESYFLYYSKEFVKDGDRISWMEGILKEKALRWHQARTQQFADLHAQDIWIAYWQSADAQFSMNMKLLKPAKR